MRQISWRIEGQCATCFEWRIGGAGWRAFSRSARKHWVHSGATLARAWRDGLNAPLSLPRKGESGAWRDAKAHRIYFVYEVERLPPGRCIRHSKIYRNMFLGTV